jgi:hypothetical protein
MVERRRDKGLTVRMLDTELTMLDELAEREGVSVSEWIRNVIRREHLVAFSSKPARTRKTKAK